MTEKKSDAIKLYNSVLKLQTVEECEKFFEDLCTTKELGAMIQRHVVASLLLDKKIYTEIMEKTNASTATISRVKRMLDQGTGCLADVITRE